MIAKTKIENKDLKQILEASMLLSGVELDGNITLALIKNRKKLVKLHADYSEAHESILKARCQKDEDNNPLLRFQKDAAGEDILTAPKKYAFETDEQERATVAELTDLAKMEVEADLQGISETSLRKITKISPEQMDAILLIAPLIEK